jgi:predicted alpha-1,6-mannanase (GH76 family)
VISNIFELAPQTQNCPNFLNSYYDDEGWWAIAWIKAYDLTQEPRYLSMAETIFADLTKGWETETCGGGIWWKKPAEYKAAIQNEEAINAPGYDILSYYEKYITLNADSIWNNARIRDNQFGMRWVGPFDGNNVPKQLSALAALNAAIPFDKK